MTGIISPEINTLLKRQATAGTEGQPKLTDSERKQLNKFYASLEKTGAGQEITPEINELLKRQANAGAPGNPPLTEEEQQKLRKFYSNQQ